jgi:hypothetical protein
MTDDAKDVTTQALRETAWRQGSLLPRGIATPPTLWAHPARQGVKAARSEIAVARRQGSEVTAPRIATRAFREDERLVVISQTCDILKAPEVLPQVEAALAITTATAEIIDEALNLGSARFRLLQTHASGEAVVLDYAWRTFLDKGFLLECEPDNTIVDGYDVADIKTLARWLGRRYARPVLGDADVRDIADPVRDRWAQLRRDEPESALRYSREYPEFRFRRESHGGLTLFVLSAQEEPDEMLGLEVAGLLAEVLEPIHGTVTVDPGKRSYHTFTKADELSTEQIDLEWASYEEGAETGVLPA